MSTEKTFNINLTIDELNLLLGALGELPAKASMGLIMNLQKQAQQQGQQPEPVEAEPVEES